MAMEEHKSCLCVDPNSINVTLDVDVRLRRELQEREEEKLSREIRRLFKYNSTSYIMFIPQKAVHNKAEKSQVSYDLSLLRYVVNQVNHHNSQNYYHLDRR